MLPAMGSRGPTLVLLLTAAAALYKAVTGTSRAPGYIYGDQRARCSKSALGSYDTSSKFSKSPHVVSGCKCDFCFIKNSMHAQDEILFE